MSEDAQKRPAEEIETKELVRLSFEHPMPKAVRDYGKVIDPNSLQAGDLILVSSRQPDFVSRKIIKHQENLFSTEHAKWQHAAISGGRFEICEATVRGVVASEYWRYMTGAYDIKIRRLRNANEATRTRLAYHAAVMVRSQYGFGNAFNLRSILKSGDFWHRSIMKSSGVICSQLFFEACMREGYLLASARPENVCPAHLSMSNLLEDVPVSWVKIG